jgi:hypothetical protein
MTVKTETTRELRALAAHELDAVTGGIIDGCIPRPKIFWPLEPRPQMPRGPVLA